MTEAVWDFIVVGAGSSGCALAHRLVRSGRYSVLLVEAGPPDDHWMIKMPKAYSHVAAMPELAWNYPVGAIKQQGAPNEIWPRGKVLGGTSSLNGMIYMRGQPQDYDEWKAAGLSGWGWNEVLGAFREIENYSLGASDLHGSGGPLTVTEGHVRTRLGSKLIEAGEQMGLNLTEDISGLAAEGIGYYSHTIRNGRRFNAARAFLKPLKNNRKLTILTGVTVNRVLVEEGRAIGIAGVKDGQACRFMARREVAICTGTIETPKLLQLSGIGPGGLLTGLGIPIVSENPAVGYHLRDHLSPHIVYRLREGWGHNGELRGMGLAMSVLRYFLRGQGVLSTGGEIGALVKADPAAERPDTQYLITGISLGASTSGRSNGVAVDRHAGLTATTCVLRPLSEGEITIVSADPVIGPAVRTNWLDHPYDRAAVLRAIRYIRRLLRQPALQGIVMEERLIGEHAQSDDEILAVLKDYIRGSNHAVGTCRMGVQGEGAIDARLRLHGVKNLRVVSCASMPTTISGNTNGPAMMFGWRVGAFMEEDAL